MKPFFLRLFPSLMDQTELNGSSNQKETPVGNRWPGLAGMAFQGHERHEDMTRKMSGRPGAVVTDSSGFTLVDSARTS